MSAAEARLFAAEGDKVAIGEILLAMVFPLNPGNREGF